VTFSAFPVKPVKQLGISFSERRFQRETSETTSGFISERNIGLKTILFHSLAFVTGETGRGVKATPSHVTPDVTLATEKNPS
jgi:hypothetical protein